MCHHLKGRPGICTANEQHVHCLIEQSRNVPWKDQTNKADIQGWQTFRKVMDCAYYGKAHHLEGHLGHHPGGFLRCKFAHIVISTLKQTDIHVTAPIAAQEI